MTGRPIEQAYLDIFGANGIPARQEIARAIDRELAALHQRVDKMEADNANMDGLRAIAREREGFGRAGIVSWAPVTTYNPPIAERTEYLLALPSGGFCIGQRHSDGTWRNSFFSREKGWVAATHFARLEGPER